MSYLSIKKQLVKTYCTTCMQFKTQFVRQSQKQEQSSTVRAVAGGGEGENLNNWMEF